MKKGLKFLAVFALVIGGIVFSLAGQDVVSAIYTCTAVLLSFYEDK